MAEGANNTRSNAVLANMTDNIEMHAITARPDDECPGCKDLK